MLFRLFTTVWFWLTLVTGVHSVWPVGCMQPVRTLVVACLHSLLNPFIKLKKKKGFEKQNSECCVLAVKQFIIRIRTYMCHLVSCLATCQGLTLVQNRSQ